MDLGAHFFKCDFQVHTPRDLNWKGASATTGDERRAYAAEFVAACRSRGLRAVAITDHHDIAFFKFIREAALSETDEQGHELPPSERLVVFPGMELTLGIPCQALLLFDADFPVEFLPPALPALGITPAPDADDDHAPIQKLDIMSFEALYEALEKLEPLRGRFIVFPHVSDGGHKTLLRGGFDKHYAKMPCVGGYVDGFLPTGAKSAGMRAITSGLDKAYGNKAIGLFQTSDNRSRDFEKLGTCVTWVKWARPTAEALRQACLARHSRLSQAEPQLPSLRILRIEVSNCKFLGPIGLDLNPQYNAIIGGRGTGKSSILEYLRWALCDQPTSTADDELSDLQRRRESLVEKTLVTLDANVQVTILVNDTEHVVRRHTDGRLLLKIGDGDLAPVTETDVRSLLPVQAYSQKQLSSVGIKGDELRRFVHLPIKAKLDGVASSLATTAGKIRAVHEDLREHRRLARENLASKTEQLSLQQQLSALRQSLKGVSDTDRQVISAQPLWAEEERIVAVWRGEAGEALSDLKKLRERIHRMPTALGPAAVNDRARMASLEQAQREMFTAVDEKLGGSEAALTGNTAERAKVREAFAAWDAEAGENRRRYNEAKGRAAESEVALKQIAGLEARQRELVAGTAQRDRRLADLADPEERYAALRKDWHALHGERYAILNEQCKRVSALSKDRLRATVGRGVGTAHIANQLKELVKGTKMRGEKFDVLLEAVAKASDPVLAWLEVVAELRALSEVEAPASGPLPSCPRLGSAQIGEPERRKMAERLATRGCGDLAVLELEDVPRFEYRVREDDYIAFSDASAGQQATTLMFVLLSQDGPPLVIDQPEDDLDNHVIKDLVEEVWLAKAKRQLIFSSHNANLVVNGDAELVVCCGYRRAGDQSGGEIKIQGAIDIDDVRAEIATVMEGGKEAFNLRKEKYNF